jgi:nitrite reductase (NADH) large subunit
VTAVGGKIAGAVLFGDTGEGSVLLGHLKRGADVSEVLQGAAAAGRPDDGDDAAAAMADHETVCNCNGVSKGAIVLAVREHGLSTVEQVRDRTKASGSCGGCKPLVAAVLKLAASGAGGAAEAEPAVCGCTSLGHAALRAALSGGAYADAGQAMRALGWRSLSGCETCRPAIRYYLGSAAEAAGAFEGAAEGAGEPVTLVPKLPGGLIAAAQLRSLAEAAERHGVPFVRLTEAARLELAGVPASQAGRLAEELGVPMELARTGDYTARVYSGAEKNGSGRELMELGAELERRLGLRRLPHGVTAAIVTALGEKAGLAVRDLGLARSPAGWELHAGGRSEPPLRQAKLLTVEPGAEEGLAAAVACLQLYRETAGYGEPLWKWLERTGLTAVREKLLDPDEREELLRRWDGGGSLAGKAAIGKSATGSASGEGAAGSGRSGKEEPAYGIGG